MECSDLNYNIQSVLTKAYGGIECFYLSRNFLHFSPKSVLPPGNYYSDSHHHRLVLFVLEYHLEGIQWRGLFYAWLLSVTIIFLHL